MSAAPSAPTRALPGLVLCLIGGLLALGVHHLVPALSTLLVAILLGIGAANTLGVSTTLAPGVAVASRRVLRWGIVLLGLSVPLQAVLALGPGVLAVVVGVVAGGIVLTLAWGKALGVPPTQRLLIACGFSICGAAAVAAVDGVIDADEEDVAGSVALVVVFGSLMIGLAPLLGLALGLGPEARGVLAGASIHEVAQVVAAGGIIGSGALAVAVLVKLARVVLLAPVMAGISLWRRTQNRDRGATGTLPPIVPLFVVGFLAAVAIRSSFDVPAAARDVAATVQTLLLATAMFALGMGVRIAGLRRLGGRTVLLGAVSTATVTVIATGGVLLVG
ncbi:YeiH family protein [Knoellia subterranea]|uniref:Membrane protein n=1 Tax=Knoellia subterranea KCTC 19937 TaxID=1385521 RepID=A0A0A0JT77_9MICO|nr:putative sulfate exporter family transporter [Knoellia subterranea]KGN39282.1 membrane protein [Knoellia subterranea KCTC 19937]